jgi:hypothetical protein
MPGDANVGPTLASVNPAIPEPSMATYVRVGTVVLSDSGRTARVGQSGASAADLRQLAVLRSDNITTMKLRETLTTLGLFLFERSLQATTSVA